MKRITLACAAVAAAMTVFPAAASACTSLQKLFGCQPTYGGGTPPPPTVKADGSLEVGSQNGGLVPLPMPVAGEPLYPRPNGKLAFGLNNEATVTPDEVAQIERGFGGSVHRLAVSWPGVEHAPGSFWWGEIDTEYRALVKQGIRPLLMVFRTPGEYVDSRWRTTEVCKGTMFRKGRSCDEPPLPHYTWRLGEFTRRLAVRYPLAAGIELWNEPNLTTGWRGTYPDPVRYAQMLGAVWDAVKKPATSTGTGGRPAMRVIGGALNARTYSNKFGLADNVFLEAMLDAGAGSKMDALSTHPYGFSADLAGMRTSLARYEAILDARPHLAGLRHVLSEIGFTTGSTEPSSQSFTLEGQATALLDTFRVFNDPAAAIPGSERVDLAIIHNLADPYGQSWFGVLHGKDPNTARYTAKPAWCAIRREVAGVTTPVPAAVTVPASLTSRC